MQFQDALTLDAPRKLRDGYLVAQALAARAGVYDYLGSEVDPQGAKFKPNDVVKVYRPAEEVFAADSVASFFAKPITNDHPTVSVTADNWKQHTRGAVMGAKRRVIDKEEYLAFDLALMDADAISAVESGKRELSNGYACDLAFEDGTAPDGTAYQAVQRNIRGNHVAIVDRGRAGSQCRIGDAKSDGGNEWSACDALPHLIDHLKGKRSMNFIMLDGLKVDLDDGDAVKALVTKLQTQASDAITARDTAVSQTVADAATIVAKDAEIAALTQKLADAAITPAKLADAAKEYADVQEKAKALGVQFAADADTASIKKAVVDAKMGDKAKDYPAEHIAIAFDSLTAGVKVGDGGQQHQQHQVITAPVALGDAAQKEHAAWQQANDHNSWRTAGTAAN